MTYTRRQLRAVTRQALEQLAREGSGAGQTMREQAQAALAQLDGEDQPADRRPLLWRRNVQPGLWVAVEDSWNVLLELTTPDEREVIGRSGPLSGDALAEAVLLARRQAADLEDEAEQARLASLRDKLAERRKG